MQIPKVFPLSPLGWRTVALVFVLVSFFISGPEVFLPLMVMTYCLGRAHGMDSGMDSGMESGKES